MRRLICTNFRSLFIVNRVAVPVFFIVIILLLRLSSVSAQTPGHIWGILTSEHQFLNTGGGSDDGVGDNGASGGNEVAMDAMGNVYTTMGNSNFLICKLGLTGKYIWRKIVKGRGQCMSIRLDQNEHIYITGYQDSGLLDFGSGILLTSHEKRRFFMLKLANNGNVIWAKKIDQIPAAGGGTDKPYGLDLDSLGNIYVCGSVSGGSFAAKHDSSGNLVWARQWGGTRATSVRADPLGDVVIGGIMSPSIRDFDPGPDTVLLRSRGSNDGYILKLDKTGNFLWVRQLGDIGNDVVFSLDIDAEGSIFSTGIFTGMVDFDPGINTKDVVSRGKGDVFVMKYDSGGNLIWVEQFGGAGNDMAWWLNLDPLGNIYVGGKFELTANFNSDLDSFNLTANGGGDAFALKLDKDGKFQHAIGFGGFGLEEVYSIAAGLNGDFALTGNMVSGSMDIDPGAGENMVVGMEWSYNQFVMKMGYCNTVTNLHYTPCDSITFHKKTYTRTGLYFDTLRNVSECDSIIAYNLEIGSSYDSTFSLSVCDSFEYMGIMRYESGIYADTFVSSSSSGCDSVIRLALTIGNSFHTVSVTTCDSFLFGTRYYSNSGDYTELFQSYLGCDSLVTLKLTITGNSPVANVILDNEILIANTAYSYQWLDCENGFAPIPGATAQMFKPEQSGMYAVIIANQQGCVDTSGCLDVSVNTSIDGLYSSDFFIYPNPVSDQVFIRTRVPGSRVSLKLSDITGAILIQQDRLASQDMMISLEGLAAGIYMLTIDQKDCTGNYKIVKQ